MSFYYTDKLDIGEVLNFIEAFLELGILSQNDIEEFILSILEESIPQNDIEEAEDQLERLLHNLEVFFNTVGEEGSPLCDPLFWSCVSRNVLFDFTFGRGVLSKFMYDESCGFWIDPARG